MKEFTFSIDEWQANRIFSPIRSKPEIIELLMDTIKIMLINSQIPDNQKRGKIILRISKMSRLFYISEDKYFSIHFPFFAIEAEGKLRFYSPNIDEIDSRVTSDVLTIIKNNEILNNPDPLDFIEPVDEIAKSSQNFWGFLRDLFLFEDGYVRCDYDEEHENKRRHPRNHLDIFYTSNSTFKLGLTKRIPYESLIDCLNIESDCHFLDTQ